MFSLEIKFNCTIIDLKIDFGACSKALGVNSLVALEPLFIQEKSLMVNRYLLLFEYYLFFFETGMHKLSDSCA
jgi:hypothetical protein